MVKPYLEPALTTQHEGILGWLSSCASMNLCESCTTARKCFHFWDTVAAKTPEQIDKGVEYYEHVWQGIQKEREAPTCQPPTLHPRTHITEPQLSLPIITREEMA